MNLRLLLRLNSLFLFLFGLAFIVRPFEMMRLYGMATVSWGVTGILAVTLLGFGLVLWSVSTLPAKSLRGAMLGSLILANALAFLVTLGQQVAIWNTYMGVLTASVFFVFTMAYGLVALKTPAPRPIDIAFTTWV